MKIIIYFLCLILQNNCYTNKTFIKFELSNPLLEKEFKERKIFYEKLLEEYFNFFLENKNLSTKNKLEKLHLIKEKYLTSLTEERRGHLIRTLKLLDSFSL